ncbi:MAG: hypothetical protein R3E12_16320 [Candidatus Eisenbacteria bacterium]
MTDVIACERGERTWIEAAERMSKQSVWSWAWNLFPQVRRNACSHSCLAVMPPGRPMRKGSTRCALRKSGVPSIGCARRPRSIRVCGLQAAYLADAFEVSG